MQSFPVVTNMLKPEIYHYTQTRSAIQNDISAPLITCKIPKKKGHKNATNDINEIIKDGEENMRQNKKYMQC